MHLPRPARVCFLTCLALAAGLHGAETVPEAEEPKDVQPGKTALLETEKGMHYFLRVPDSYHSKRGARLVVFLHGSNRNGLTYLRSFEARKWADDAILACPNGEKGDDPYGANNFTFDSAPFVAQVTEDVQRAFKTTVTYVGGHSQGGFLTYSVILLFPDLYHGALPMAGDCWMQNEPNLWEDKPKLLERQRGIAIAVIHGRKDPVIAFSQGQHAFDIFRAMGYPRLRFFAPEGLGHQFMLAPVDEALAWLDAVVGPDPVHRTRKAVEWAKAGDWGWAVQAARGVLAMKRKPAVTKKSSTSILKAAEKVAKKKTAVMEQTMQEESAATWVPRWFDYRLQFGATRSARELVRKYEKMRSRQRALGGRLYQKARGLFREKKQEAGYAALEELLEKAPASYEAYYAVEWLKGR